MVTERIVAGVALVIVTGNALADLVEDSGDEAGWLELSLDLGSSLFVAGALLYIWIHRPKATAARNRALEVAVQSTRKDLREWKNVASNLLRDLGEKMEEQFEKWSLTTAEKEVALLLVKGVSLKEIAAARGTGEKTVRQQASQVYAKASLENRAELAAFFLEDLSLP